ncbi:MAG: hypothetical protein Q8Q14_10085 [Gemmatimonadales bacterium]|nr:hypothetical protein [Gemmatimonadales bacterium]
MLADNNASNNSYAIAVTVNAPSVHVGDVDGAAASSGNNWSATVVIAVHDTKHLPLSGVTVTGNWNGSGPVGQCTTGDGADAGTCTVVLASIPNSTRMVSFGVTGMARE